MNSLEEPQWAIMVRYMIEYKNQGITMSYKKISTIDQKKVQKTVSELLTALGEDIKRDGLKDTPRRIARMYNELLGGYRKDPKSVFKVFNSEVLPGVPSRHVVIGQKGNQQEHDDRKQNHHDQQNQSARGG